MSRALGHRALEAVSRFATACVPLALLSLANCGGGDDESGGASVMADGAAGAWGYTSGPSAGGTGYGGSTAAGGATAAGGGSPQVVINGGGAPPPPDRDNDGIIDLEDDCPDLMGVFNEMPGLNGCPLPPEQEIENTFRAPVATGHFLWTANPDTGYVAVVDARPDAPVVRVVQAGHAPTYLAGVYDPERPDDDAAIVLNVLSDDATLLRIGSDDSITPETFPVHQTANAWAVSGRGSWAIAWSDAGRVANADPTEGFYDITVIPLSGGEAQPLSVGYRPVSVDFNEAETQAYVVARDSISVIDLQTFQLEQIEFADDPATGSLPEQERKRDVTITPDGSLALVQRDYSHEVEIISLDTGERSIITLSGPVTDLDLSEDGTLAVAVVQARYEVALLPVPEVAEDPSVVETLAVGEELIGSVALSSDGGIALLYLTGQASDRLTILQTDPAADPAFRTVWLQTPVKAVFPSPDARHAVVLQDPGEQSSKAGAFSVVPVEEQIWPKLVGTDAEPTAVAIDPEGGHGLVTVRDDAHQTFGVYLVTMSTLRVDYLRLASPPLATGIVPEAQKGYVAQQHPEGQLTVIDFKEPGGAPRTVTGFELSATR